jgi:hypothetical protein
MEEGVEGASVKLLELLGLVNKEFLINLKCTFMHDEWQLFGSTLLVEVEESLLISVWRREERKKHMRGRSPRFTERGGARAHDVHVNSP